MESYNLYLDASGDPGWTEPWGKSPLRYYVMAGIALTPEMNHIAQEDVERILNKYIPWNIRSQYPPEQFELHYEPLAGGRGIYKHLQPIERKNMADEVFDLISRLNPILFASVVDKTEMKIRYGAGAFNPTRYAIRSTIDRFCFFLNRIKGLGSVVIDEEEYKKDKALREMIHSFRSSGMTITGFTYNPSRTNKLERILNTVSFSPSEMSAGIQLADFISRGTWLHFERGKSNRFHQLIGWDHDGSRQYEPCKIP